MEGACLQKPSLRATSPRLRIACLAAIHYLGAWRRVWGRCCRCADADNLALRSYARLPLCTYCVYGITWTFDVRGVAGNGCGNGRHWVLAKTQAGERRSPSVSSCL